MEKKEHTHKKHEPHKLAESEGTSSVSFDAKTIVMMVLVGLLVIVSGIQALELSSLQDKLSEDGVKLSTGSTKTSIGATAGAGSSLSKNLDSLPTMVGGC